MAAQAASLVVLLLWSAQVLAANIPDSCSEGQSCSMQDAPRAAGALLQTAGSAKTGSDKTKVESAPLKGRVGALEGDLASLEARVALLESEVGNIVAPGASAPVAPASPPAMPPQPTPTMPPQPPPPPPADAAPPADVQPEIIDLPVPALQQQQQQQQQRRSSSSSSKEKARQMRQLAQAQRMEDEAWLYPNGYASGYREEAVALLQEVQHKNAQKKTGSLKDRLTDAEQRASTLRSKIVSLENALVGGSEGTFDGAQGSAADLKHRIVSLEDAVDDLLTRTSTLEHQLTGATGALSGAA